MSKSSQEPRITLYGFVPQDRSGRVRWLLEEMELKFESRFVSWENSEHKSSEFLRLNPMGRVPVLEIDGRVLTESGAIVLSLVDLFPERGLAPAPGTVERERFYEWVLFAASTMEPPFEMLWFSQKNASESEKAKALEIFMESGRPMMAMLERALDKGPYLLGERFSAADIMVGSTLVFGQGVLIHSSKPIAEYFARISSREACVKSGIFAKGNT